VPPLTPGVELTGRYQLGRRLSDDGLVQTWTATDRVLARGVEVEVLCREAGPGARDAFLASAGVLARLTHGGIVSAYDTGESADGLPFLVTERAIGPTLAELVERHGPMAPTRVAGIGAQLARALETAHRAGTAHGSITAAAVQVGSDDRAKLSGFTSGGVRARLEGTPADAPGDVRALARTLEVASATAPAAAASRGGGRAGPADRAGTLADVLAAAASEGAVTSASRLAEELERLVGDDGPPTAETPAVPAVPAAPTAPTGLPATSAGGRAGAIAGIAVGLLLAVGVGVAAYVLFNGGTSSPGPPAPVPGTTPTAVGPSPGAGLTVALAHSFDPFGDHTEMEPVVNNVHDGDPTTVWTTEEYRSADFGGLKPGVGLYLLVDGVHRLTELALTSPSRSWTFDVYVASRASPTLAGWGVPVANGIEVTGATTVVGLHGASGSAVLVWITNLGPPLQPAPDPATPYRVTIDEIVLR